MEKLVADRIREALPNLPRAERRAARTVLAAYPVAGLETVARLAARARVSGPTIIRLVTRLGFEGFPSFQQALLREIDERATSPLLQYQQRSFAADVGVSHAPGRSSWMPWTGPFRSSTHGRWIGS